MKYQLQKKIMTKKKMSKNKSSWKRNKLPKKIKLGLDNLRGSYREFRKALD